MLLVKEFLQAQGFSAPAEYTEVETSGTDATPPAETCALILDRQNLIVAAHRHGVLLGDAGFVEICTQAWADVLEGPDGATARSCVDLAFQGQRSGFQTVWHGPGYATHWDVTMMPLQDRDNRIQHILICAKRTDISRRTETDLREELRDIAHTLANLTSVTRSGAKILRRDGMTDDLRGDVADGLAESAAKADAALERLRAILK
ncbi:hypothetical protein RPE78_06500 [Thioclava litoralis]|uniref:PAS fold-containing protein n=1 Tax=Thioclava litoralis TaxID=3076557 RepID=A0ABZ1E3K5_9RHOB|nr:hypothetical protein RPE78_06500 [Thioclava sp. FTW29]